MRGEDGGDREMGPNRRIPTTLACGLSVMAVMPLSVVREVGHPVTGGGMLKVGCVVYHNALSLLKSYLIYVHAIYI
jgi:hypothetical protein